MNLFLPDSLFSRFEPTGRESVTLEFLGTAGFLVNAGDRALVFDPYVSRPGLWRHRDRLRPNESLIRREIIERPGPLVREVFVGHAHSDHILDAPFLCRETGARLIGSRSVCRTGRAAGVPEEQIVPVTRDRQVIACGEDASVTAMHSRHASISRDQKRLRRVNAITKAIVGRPVFETGEDGSLSGVPFDGETSDHLEWPAHVWELRCGQVFDWHVDIDGVSIVHIDSAELRENQFRGLTADIVCLCAIGRENSEFDYTRKVLEELRPQVVIPCHWDFFFRDYRRRPRSWPGVHLASWLREIEAIGKDRGIETHLLRFGGVFGV